MLLSNKVIFQNGGQTARYSHESNFTRTWPDQREFYSDGENFCMHLKQFALLVAVYNYIFRI